MILRRFTQHVQTQNWVAVGLDFIVVVLGLFIGFQLDRWYEARRDYARETVYLERLMADVAMMKAGDGERHSVTWSLASGRERARVASVAIEALQSCEVPDEGLGDVARGLGIMSMMPSVTPRRAAYDEIISSGALAHIEDIKLKEATATLFDRFDHFEDQLAYYRIFSVHADRVTQKYVDFQFDSGNPEFYELEASFDLGEICNSRELQNAMVGGLDSLHDWVWHMEQINEAVGELSKRLEAELAARR